MRGREALDNSELLRILDPGVVFDREEADLMQLLMLCKIQNVTVELFDLGKLLHHRMIDEADKSPVDQLHDTLRLILLRSIVDDYFTIIRHETLVGYHWEFSDKVLRNWALDSWETVLYITSLVFILLQIEVKEVYLRCTMLVLVADRDELNILLAHKLYRVYQTIFITNEAASCNTGDNLLDRNVDFGELRVAVFLGSILLDSLLRHLFLFLFTTGITLVIFVLARNAEALHTFHLGGP